MAGRRVEGLALVSLGRHLKGLVVAAAVLVRVLRAPALVLLVCLELFINLEHHLLVAAAARVAGTRGPRVTWPACDADVLESLAAENLLPLALLLDA